MDISDAEPRVGSNGLSSLSVSIVMPCLNEADTLERCITKAQRALQDKNISGEIVIADNASTDGSPGIASRMGARVVHVEAKGYGNALMGGIAAAQGEFIIMGDADDSYDFAEVSKFIDKLQEDGNPLATLVADLTKPNNIPSNQFDCIICTHVLHIIADIDKAVSEMYRILKPGGVLLTAVPHVSMCDPGFHELWRFTPEGLASVLAKAFGTGNVTMRAYGNSLTAAGETRGLITREFSKAALAYHDPRFAVEVCARAYRARN